jgi:regulator of sigma D
MEKTTTSFRNHFDSCFSTGRFSIEDSVQHQYVAFVKRNGYFLRYAEIYNAQTNPTSLTLDFDGSANNVPSQDCLTVADNLHALISNEYEATIKDPLYSYMRGEIQNVH